MTIAIKEFPDEEDGGGAFKANCLAVMDEVQAKHETVVITKHGKPVAKLVPVNTGTDEVYDFLRGFSSHSRSRSHKPKSLLSF